MNTYITGATGTIGRHFVNSARKIDVDLEKDFVLSPEIASKGEFTLVHLAGKVGVEAVSRDIDLAFKVNVTSSRLLAEECIKAGIKKFIYVSTSHVYQRSNELLDENSPTNPLNVYSQQKRMAELEIIDAFRATPERLVIARVFSILDWGTPEFTLGGAVLKLLRGEISSLNAGMDLRDFLTPKKVASILMEIAVSTQLSGIVNICSSNPISIADAAGRMLKEAGAPELALKIVSEHSMNPVIVGSNQKLKKAIPNLDLQWVPSKLTH
jgi:nucleoside-diphosphate-sugar epimerase